MSNTLEVPTCTNCGSEELSRDAYANWNIGTQSWEVSSVYDFFICDQCGESAQYANWKEIDE